MKTISIISLAAVILAAECRQGLPTDAWPAESWSSAEILTHLDTDFQNNVSGASWNPTTRTFWVCRNGGPSAFWALTEDGSNSLIIATNAAGVQGKYDPGSGDFEGICQSDYSEEVVYLLAESSEEIREYDISNYGSPILNRRWDISAYIPTSGAYGPEGITFVPDEWLSNEHFVDRHGQPYTSTNGMHGLMFVAHQNGGRIYVFDLNRSNGICQFVGAYKTSRSESSGLEFDRSSGLLYVWHNIGPNYLEVTELSSYQDGSEQRLTPLAEFYGPKSGNLEGIALTPAATTDNWCLIVDDDNQDGAALMWFKQFEHTNDFDGDRIWDQWELTYLSSTTVSDGSADNDGDGFSDFEEYLAGTVPTNPASLLSCSARVISQQSLVILEWQSASNKSYCLLSSTSLLSPFAVITNGIPATPPTNTFTDSIAGTDAAYYRVRLDF